MLITGERSDNAEIFETRDNGWGKRGESDERRDVGTSLSTVSRSMSPVVPLPCRDESIETAVSEKSP